MTKDEHNDTIKKIVIETGLTPSVVEGMVKHQYKFLRMIMTQGGYHTVKLPEFGTFIVPWKKLRYYMKNHINTFEEEQLKNAISYLKIIGKWQEVQEVCKVSLKESSN